MASAILSHLQSLWPFSLSKADDLRTSTRLVKKLSIPEQTKQFVFAFREPDSDAVVYILAAQNLSEQSALDAERLIKEVKPKAVVAQIAASALTDVQAEEKSLMTDNLNSVPTSSFEVLKRCFIEKLNRNHYENFAGSQVLQEIFGIGFYGHFLAAKRAAEETGSHFVLVQSPYSESCTTSSPASDNNLGGTSGLFIQSSCLVPGKVAPFFYSSPKRLCISDPRQLQLVKSAIPYLDLVLSKESHYYNTPPEEARKCQPVVDYTPPSFAQSVYPLLQDLHDIFADLPSIQKALVSAQKMLDDVSEGKPVETQTLSDIYSFRTAVEFIRLTLNNAGHSPIDRISNSGKLDFFDLPAEEQSHVLFAQTLKSQAKKFGSVVAVVDAGRLVGLRRHWNTSMPVEVADLVKANFVGDHDDTPKASQENVMEKMGKKGLLADKPVVAVGAGATAVLGASSLSKAIPASTLVKFAAYKIPVTFNFGLAHIQRLAGIGLGKIFGSSKLFAHGVVGAGTKSSALKFTASAEKIRAVTHTMIASAERTSLMAMRTSLYEIMQRRHVRPIRVASLATFTCSMAACTGLVLYGDGIECVAESVPSVPMIASLGRGLESLREASIEVRQTNGTRVHEALHSLMYKLKKMRVQVN